MTNEKTPVRITNEKLREMLRDYPDHWEVKLETPSGMQWSAAAVDAPEEEDLLDGEAPYLTISA